MKQPYRRPAVFKLPSFLLRKKGAQAGRMSRVTVQETSARDRILQNTPVLQKIQEIVNRPMP